MGWSKIYMLREIDYYDVIKLKKDSKISLHTFWYEGSNYRHLFEGNRDKLLITFNPIQERFEVYSDNR